jgi:hypothetical protein
MNTRNRTYHRPKRHYRRLGPCHLQLFAALVGVGVGMVVAGIDGVVEVSGREGNGSGGVDGSGGGES